MRAMKLLQAASVAVGMTLGWSASAATLVDLGGLEVGDRIFDSPVEIGLAAGPPTSSRSLPSVSRVGSGLSTSPLC